MMMFIQVDSTTFQVISVITDSSGVDMTNYIEVKDEASIALIKRQMLSIDPLMRLYYDAKKKTVSMKLHLGSFKEYKVRELSSACMQACEEGYTCNALGQAHMYPSCVLDQQNLLSTYVAAQINKDAVHPVLCAKLDGTEWKMRDHTFDQLMAVIDACTAMTMTNRTKYNQLRASVENATTQEDVEVIKW